MVVRMNRKICISRQHGGEAGSQTIVEDVDRLSVLLGISQLITYPEGRAGAFGNDNIGFPQPGGVLLIDGNVRGCLLERQITDMLSLDGVILLHIFNKLMIKHDVCPTAANRPCKINLHSSAPSVTLCILNRYLSQLRQPEHRLPRRWLPQLSSYFPAWKNIALLSYFSSYLSILPL